MREKAESKTDHLPNQTTGRYRVQEVLSRRGIAVVYRATGPVSRCAAIAVPNNGVLKCTESRGRETDFAKIVF